MNTKATAIHRRVRDAVRDTVSAYRIQGSAGGGWTEKAIDEILFRGSHNIMQALASYPSPVVHALMPSVVRFMLQAFLEIDATEAAVPAHVVQKMALQADTIRGLDAKVRELEVALASVRRKGERGQ